MLKKPWVFFHDREHKRCECSEIKGTNYWGKGCRYDSTSNEFKKPHSVLYSFNQSEMNVSVSKSVSLKQLHFYTKEWHLCLFTFYCRTVQRICTQYKWSPQYERSKRNRSTTVPLARSAENSIHRDLEFPPHPPPQLVCTGGEGESSRLRFGE